MKIGSFGNAVLQRFLHTDHFSEIRIFSRDEKKQELEIVIFTGKYKAHEYGKGLCGVATWKTIVDVNIYPFHIINGIFFYVTKDKSGSVHIIKELPMHL